MGEPETVSNRQQQKAQTREEILRAAAAQFAERGFDATSLADIAAEMGRPKSALGYHQFRSKDEIANAVVTQKLHDWDAIRMRADRHEPAGVPRLLTLLLTAAVDARADAFGLATIRLILESRRFGRFELPGLPFNWFDYTDSQLRDAVQLGQLPPEAEPREVGQLIINAAFGLFESENQGFQPVDTEAGLRDIWLRLLVGLGAADPEGLVASTIVLDGRDLSGMAQRRP
ncbi:TetR family transcriptional regulator [Herbiconiux sp. P18]|uniref:TetR family transcriptional regulator n=1 Tax=Herbiconiux liangxiaofengii TaxID=3342795 RepID=UPI0035B86D25